MEYIGYVLKYLVETTHVVRFSINAIQYTVYVLESVIHSKIFYA